MSVIILDREILHYEVLGRGRPLIFLHGWVGSWRYWIPVMQAATMSYRAYALDFWGFGDSAKAKTRYSMAEQVHLLDGFLDQMGILRVALVGHGLGALVALQYAAAHPDTVDRVMAVGYPMEESSLNVRLRTTAPAGLADWLLARSPVTDPVRAEVPKTDPLALSASFDGLTSLGYKALWGQSRTACLLVHGQNDPGIAPPNSDQFAALPSQAHAILFEESGHFPMLDETSKFTRLLIDFLALASGETPRDLQLKEEWKRRVR
jgi:pimeloyl-ACP methyl ester carboxylesterase